MLSVGRSWQRSSRGWKRPVPSRLTLSVRGLSRNGSVGLWAARCRVHQVGMFLQRPHVQVLAVVLDHSGQWSVIGLSSPDTPPATSPSSSETGADGVAGAGPWHPCLTQHPQLLLEFLGGRAEGAAGDGEAHPAFFRCVQASRMACSDGPGSLSHHSSLRWRKVLEHLFNLSLQGSQMRQTLRLMLYGLQVPDPPFLLPDFTRPAGDNHLEGCLS